MRCWVRSMTGVAIALGLLATGCAGAFSGKRLVGEDSPSRKGPFVARVSTAEPDGLRVLFKGTAFGGYDEQSGWIAGTATQFGTLWKKVGLRSPPPDVDFSRYVAVGLAGRGGVCTSEVTHVTVDARGVLELQYAKPTRCPATGLCACEDVATHVAEVVAVPRRLLGKRLEFVGEHAAFLFDVPEPEQAFPVARSATPVNPGDFSRAERVELPPKGHMTLRTLRNNSEVWVTHDPDGSVSVFSSTCFSKNEAYRGWPLRWSEMGRFTEGYDAHGRNVHGLVPSRDGMEPLRGYAWKSQDETHILVGGAVEIPPGPIQPRVEAPILDGPDRAYTQLQPLRGWEALADGYAGLLDLDIVVSPSSDVRLCKAPLPEEPHGDFAGCPLNAPFLARYPQERAGGKIAAYYGPFVVLRQGSTARILGKPP